MDHVYILLILIVPCSVLCGHVPAPVNITMDSHHFVHLLTWQAGADSPVGLRYRVHIRTYKEDWRMVDSCGAVRYPLICNLTDVFTDVELGYYINVTAVLGNETSTPRSYNQAFYPVQDTVLELPSLRISPCNDSLCVYLQSPSERLLTAYMKFKYTLNVTSENGNQFLNTVGLKTVSLSVVPGKQYCVSVNINGGRSTSKPPVCASNPAAVNNMDAVISLVLFLLVLILVFVGLLVLKSFLHLKPHQPLVLSSFKAPYKVQLVSLSSVESLKCILLEPNTHDAVQVNEDMDQEKEDEEVAYEGRKGCEEISDEHTHNLVTETYTYVPGTCLKEPVSAPDMISLDLEPTTPQTTSRMHTTHLFPLITPIQELKKKDLALLRHKRGDEFKQEDKEDSGEVNFFSLILGSQNSEQEEETEKEEEMENVKKVKSEVPLFVLGPSQLAMDIQPMYSESTNISYCEEEEEYDTEEEEAFSGYMMRN